MLIRRVSRTKLQSGLSQRSVALSIPKRIATPFSKEIQRWFLLSGEQWTVDRIKAIKLDILREKAGLLPVSTWISRSKTGFRGSIGLLEKWMLAKESNFAKGLQLLQCYTLFYASSVTDKQKKKFLDGVLSPPPLPDQLQIATEVVLKGYELADSPRPGKLEVPSPLEAMLPSPNKRAPLPDGSVPEDQGIVDSIRFLYDSFEGIRHLNRFYESHYKHVLSRLESALFDGFGHFMSPAGYPYPLDDRSTLLAGRIGLIQEAGYKLRAVANPGRVFQRALQPFGDAIYRIIKHLPWDCTFDQAKAVPILKEHLHQGKMVYSIDLSGATDYFPLHLQTAVLSKMFKKQDVLLFHELSTASWEFPNHGEVQWKRGQPLGLYPSFGAFALTHGMLLLGLLGREYEQQFFVLGDDVVILDDQLALDYKAMMHSLGCPVSEAKTLSSSSVCEFAGKVITSTKVIPQLKWRDVSDDSFLDIARLLGPQSIRLFKPRQVAVIKKLMLVPDFLGGLGWNPDGLPLEFRCNQPWIWSDQKPVDHLMGYSSSVIRNLMKSNLFGHVVLSHMGLQSYVLEGTDLDQRSSHLAQSLLGPSFRCFPIGLLGKNVDMVSLSLYGKHADLPIDPGEGMSLRPSLLMSWEAKLNHLQ
jgi:hypothetical protein